MAARCAGGRAAATTLEVVPRGAASAGGDDILVCGGLPGFDGPMLSRLSGTDEVVDPQRWEWGFHGCTMLADDEGFAVGPRGTLVRWNGTSGETVRTGIDDLHAIWGDSADYLMIAATDGILHWGGAEMTATFDNYNHQYYGIDGVARDDLWAAGNGADGTSIVHWDGTAWSPAYDRGFGGSLHAVAAHRTDDAWVVGDFHQILRWDGSQWAEIELPAGLIDPPGGCEIPDFDAVEVAPSGDVWIGGWDERGTVLLRGIRD